MSGTDSPEAILRAEGMTKRFGGVVASEDVSIAVLPGETHAVIGPNGAGKSTLIAQISGELRPDRGQVFFAGRDISNLAAPARARCGLVRSYQITSIMPNLTVEDNVALAVQATQSHSYRFWSDARRDRSLREPARAMLEQVGLHDRADHTAAALAHGEQRQLEIAMALALKPRLLLLDEPLAGMGIEESARISRLLARLKGKTAMLLVEHDMDAVFSLADRITVLVYGRVLVVGDSAHVRADPGVREAYLGGDDG